MPCNDLHLGLAGDIGGQETVGNHDHPVGAEAFHHFQRIGRGAADVHFRLHLGRGVDIGDDRNARILAAQGADVGARDRGGERTAGFGVRNQHGLVRAEDFRGLGHEMDAALHDDVGVRLAGDARELERIPDHVGDAIVDFRRLVIMRQDDGVALLFQVVDRLHIGRVERPFDRRDDRLDLFIEMRGLAGDFRRPRQTGHGDGAMAQGGRARLHRGRGRNLRRQDTLHDAHPILCSL